MIFIVAALSVLPNFSEAETQNYLREFEYTAASYDTEYSSRIRAVDGVKQSLIDELGIYVESVIKINEDSLGNSYISKDIKTLAAGIISMKVMDENWNNIRFYIKASMKADPNEVLNSLKKLQNNNKFEEVMRKSIQDLKLAREEIEKLRVVLDSSNKNSNNSRTVNAYQSAIKKLEFEQKFQKAMFAYVRGDFDTMIKIMTVLANKGIGSAQAKLGWLYERGIGVKEDFILARTWYDKAIKQNNGFAYSRVGYMYERGLGVIQNYYQAVKFYNKALEYGEPAGHAHLGYAHLTGSGVERDYDKAFQYFLTSANKGSPLGIAWLTMCYRQGIGTERDTDKAIKLIMKSVKQSNPLGLAMLGDMYLKGTSVEQSFETALKYIRASAKRGNPFGIGLLGFMFENGYGGVERDESKAAKYYNIGAQQKDIFSQMRLARVYWLGLGVPADAGKSEKILKSVIKKGTPDSKHVASIVLSFMSDDDNWSWDDRYLYFD